MPNVPSSTAYQLTYPLFHLHMKAEANLSIEQFLASLYQGKILKVEKKFAQEMRDEKEND
jgi:hypothetical protein